VLVLTSWPPMESIWSPSTSPPQLQLALTTTTHFQRHRSDVSANFSSAAKTVNTSGLKELGDLWWNSA
jgi:hypothetical protein